MVVLDTDHLSLFTRDILPFSDHLSKRLATLPKDQVATTIVTYEEQTRGCFAYLAKARTMSAQVDAYRRLARHLDNYKAMQVLPFDEVAAAVFQDLQKRR